MARGVHDKLRARHPHVFAGVDVADADEVRTNWEAIKRAEKGRGSVMDGVPSTLPAAAYAETSGTYVNIEGNAQSFRGVAAPPGETRPGWKILRVLGNLVGLDGFDYAESTAVRDEALTACADLAPDNRTGDLQDRRPRSLPGEWERVGGVPIYSVDALSRRAHALQLTPDAWGRELRLNAAAAAALDLEPLGGNDDPYTSEQIPRARMGELTVGATVFDRRRVPAWRHNMDVAMDMQAEAVTDERSVTAPT